MAAVLVTNKTIAGAYDAVKALWAEMEARRVELCVLIYTPSPVNLEGERELTRNLRAWLPGVKTVICPHGTDTPCACRYNRAMLVERAMRMTHPHHMFCASSYSDVSMAQAAGIDHIVFTPTPERFIQAVRTAMLVPSTPGQGGGK